MPTNRMPTISSEVAIGCRMNGAEMYRHLSLRLFGCLLARGLATGVGLGVAACGRRAFALDRTMPSASRDWPADDDFLALASDRSRSAKAVRLPASTLTSCASSTLLPAPTT